MASVLVAHASKYGSTQEVAEAVAVILREAGFEADVRPSRDVADVAGYSAVILGGALYFFRLHSDARHFLSRHRRVLTVVPVAVFAMGPINDTPEELDGARKHLERALAKYSWLSPASTAVFGGRLDPARLRFPDSNPAFKSMSASDIRDWDAIRAWAASLPGALGLAASE
jgi:menaquinone-dependent protoporphyrinogen oxidase